MGWSSEDANILDKVLVRYLIYNILMSCDVKKILFFNEVKVWSIVKDFFLWENKHCFHIFFFCFVFLIIFYETYHMCFFLKKVVDISNLT